MRRQVRIGDARVWRKLLEQARGQKTDESIGRPTADGGTEQMNALGRRFVDWLRMKLRWRRSCVTTVSRNLADDLGVPEDAIHRILDQTAADLREAESDQDCGPIINKAIEELNKYAPEPRPFEEATMERCLGELPEREFTMLRHFKQGKKHREIAELMDTDVESVRRTLIQTYSDLRMKMRAVYTDAGGELLEREQSRAARMADHSAEAEEDDACLR
jgi:DNA-directed RNA polymerase specialized sigma24 family protein